MPVVRKRSIGERIFDTGNVILLILICMSTIYPFLYITAMSFSGNAAVLRGEVTIVPIDFSTKAYEEIFKNHFLFLSYGNTIFVVVVGTALALLVTAFAAYPLSKRFLVGRPILAVAIAVTLWFNPGLIPRFLVVRELGLLDSLWAVILAPLVSAFHVIVMRSFFDNMPESLEDSARMDGAGYFTVLFRIVLPLSKPVLATVALWKAVQYWNMFLAPLLYLQSPEKYTLQLVLREIVIANMGLGFGQEGMDMEFQTVGESVRAGTIMVATVPILLVYPFIQKHFAKGVMVGSIKG